MYYWTPIMWIENYLNNFLRKGHCTEVLNISIIFPPPSESDKFSFIKAFLFFINIYD